MLFSFATVNLECFVILRFRAITCLACCQGLYLSARPADLVLGNNSPDLQKGYGVMIYGGSKAGPPNPQQHTLSELQRTDRTALLPSLELISKTSINEAPHSFRGTCGRYFQLSHTHAQPQCLI